MILQVAAIQKTQENPDSIHSICIIQQKITQIRTYICNNEYTHIFFFCLSTLDT